MVDQMILDIDYPTRYPQYYFDYDNLIQLTHKGLTLEQVHKYLHSFNRGIKEKIMHPYQKEVSYDVIQEIKESCGASMPHEKACEPAAEEDNVDFDF